MEKDKENNDETEKSMDSVESVQKEDEVVSPSSSSPETECAICLEAFKNKSFTDSCSHMFCFKCLVDWSKVKPECPFCKQSFSSIVHNVRSSTDYDRYYVNKSTQNEGSHYIRRLEFAATSTPERSHDSNEMEAYISHRMQFAPHSMQSFSIPRSNSVSNLGGPSSSNAIEDDDEVKIIDDRKPTSEKMCETDEVSDIESNSVSNLGGPSSSYAVEDDDEVKIIDDRKPTSEHEISDTESEVSDDTVTLSDDDDCEIVYFKS